MALSHHLLLALTAAVLVPVPAHAASVYKCAQPDGRTVFSDVYFFTIEYASICGLQVTLPRHRQ